MRTLPRIPQPGQFVVMPHIANGERVIIFAVLDDYVRAYKGSNLFIIRRVNLFPGNHEGQWLWIEKMWDVPKS